MVCAVPISRIVSHILSREILLGQAGVAAKKLCSTSAPSATASFCSAGLKAETDSEAVLTW